MIEFIKDNINWIKNIALLIFAGTATIIGVLTYRRARATLLQPIRSEAIKRQSDLLVRFLKFLKDNDQSFEKGIDYIKMVEINVFCALRDYGFVFKEQKDLFDELDKRISGWTYCGKNNIIKEAQIIGTFKSNINESKKDNPGKSKYEKLKNGEIEIDIIYRTITLSNFVKELSDFLNDPFMPKSIQKTLSELMNDVENNIIHILKSEVEKFMLDFGKGYFKDGKAPKFDYIGVYNSFNHKRIHHHIAIVKLRKEIRKYLLIDEPW